VVAKSPDRLAYVVPKEGGTLWIDNLAIPKTARNLDSAYTFLDYVLKPDVAATIVNGVHYAGANQAALPLIDAGHQERGRRPGTENVLGIVGFGAAAAEVDIADWPAVAALGDRLEAGLVALDGVRIHGAGAPRIGGTINAGFAGARGESIVIALDLAGIAASTGAACTSGSVKPSEVLLALGLPEATARSAVRFSLGRTTTAAEIAAVLAALPAIVHRARRHV